jgi:hypothetical protein
MVSFRTKNPNLGKFWRALKGKMLIYFRTFWNILRAFGIFYYHLVLFAFIWCICSGFGIMYQEKSGHPGHHGQNSQFLQPINLCKSLAGTNKVQAPLAPQNML